VPHAELIRPVQRVKAPSDSIVRHGTIRFPIISIPCN
jgi:hypothetical protein